ncbi:DUF547 domain-containing protein [Sanyastnella coralliicola]|uniref:DUF547 domain-containing protein n=1 Tax=Sanyastnella coralliicola TaxID=3069118 RepID=UPI0027B97BF2|nr:DUF547 domain-containing protein [Longitalea sp. SCSIO 12813]
MLRISALIFLGYIILGCGVGQVHSDSPPFRHDRWNSLVEKHVSEDGWVNYDGFIADSVLLNSYLDLVETHHPNQKWSITEQKAYWINAYNAFTVRLIIRNYPTESIKDLGGSLYKINTPWDIRFIMIEGQDYDLNNIEHDILRKQWDDPRIHFAINCASVSCPKLLNHSFSSDVLNVQLDQAARDFINDPSRNTITAERAELSRIFKWFKGDFTKEMELWEYINQFSVVKITADTKISFKEYDWNLNSQ